MGLQTQKFWIFIFPWIFFFFFWILSCSMSHMYDLDYIMLQYSNTHLYKLSENRYFYQVIFNRFCFIFGRGRFYSLVKNNLRAKGLRYKVLTVVLILLGDRSLSTSTVFLDFGPQLKSTSSYWICPMSVCLASMFYKVILSRTWGFIVMLIWEKTKPCIKNRCW